MLSGRCSTALHRGEASKLNRKYSFGFGNAAMCKTTFSRSRGGTERFLDFSCCFNLGLWLYYQFGECPRRASHVPLVADPFSPFQEALQPLVFDDPSTSQPDDFWLHPCDCLPQQWGTEWPADPIALENIPPTSNGSFIPEPFSIVVGQFACPSRQLLKGAKGIHFSSEAESMEPADCEETRVEIYQDTSIVVAYPYHQK